MTHPPPGRQDGIPLDHPPAGDLDLRQSAFHGVLQATENVEVVRRDLLHVIEGEEVVQQVMELLVGIPTHRPPEDLAGPTVDIPDGAGKVPGEVYLLIEGPDRVLQHVHMAAHQEGGETLGLRVGGDHSLPPWASQFRLLCHECGEDSWTDIPAHVQRREEGIAISD